MVRTLARFASMSGTFPTTTRETAAGFPTAVLDFDAGRPVL